MLIVITVNVIIRFMLSFLGRLIPSTNDIQVETFISVGAALKTCFNILLIN